MIEKRKGKSTPHQGQQRVVYNERKKDDRFSYSVVEHTVRTEQRNPFAVLFVLVLIFEAVH